MRSRLIAVLITTFALFSLLIVRYFQIQVVEQEKWSRHAFAQHSTLVDIPFRRGTFFSNTEVKNHHYEENQPLALDVVKFHLHIDPSQIPPKCATEMIRALSEKIEIKDPKRFADQFAMKSRNRRLAMWLDREQKEEIQNWFARYRKSAHLPANALFFVRDYKRSYPFGKLLGQVLHTIRDRKEEETMQGVPTGGLEAFFHEKLKGKKGRRRMLRSPLNTMEADEQVDSPQDGADIYLTINHTLQAIAEEELERGARACEAKGGWAVMMDPHSGELLALAHYPFFEPERYPDYFNDPKKLIQTSVRAISDAHEVGSVMKPLIYALFLQANQELLLEGQEPLFDPLAKMETTRSRFPGRMNHPLKDTSPSRYLNLDMALRKSSNIYIAEVMERLMERKGRLWLRENLCDCFGLSKKTGVELPGEASGFLPSPGRTYSNGALEWSLPTPYSLAMGHNLLVTGVQLVRAYAVLANGGFLVEPTLVKKIVHKNPERCEVWETSSPKRVLSSEVTDRIVEAMKYVTKRGGTGWRGDIYGYSEAGKSGTAEKIENGVYSREKYLSSFVGFAPAQVGKNTTRFVLLVTLEEPSPTVRLGGSRNYHGGACAAPIFREIARRSLEYLGVAPDDPYGYPRNDPRRDAQKADWLVETAELDALYKSWNR